MERHGRVSEGSQSDPSPEWTAPGTETGPEGLGVGAESYPERPDEADCIHYVRTGFCAYGSRCRFNHPRDRGSVMGAARAGGGEFPERVGQPVCQYYMRTGTCKYGASCKYHHPRQGAGSVSNVSLNYYGYPLRPPAGVPAPTPSPAPQVAAVPTPVPAPALYPPLQSPSVPSAQQYGVVVARPPLLHGSYVQGPYGPVLVSPSMFSLQGWSPYATSLNPISSPGTGTQSSVGSSSIYGITQLSASAPAYTGTYQSLPSSVGPSSSSQKEHPFPERPGQQECQYYMKTGDCKFGSSCRFHHPRELIVPKMDVTLSPFGLPLRPVSFFWHLLLHYYALHE
ncbi:hypothetical protein CUMW_019820 [Citrus unshiu]|nr:hypothetical protein CUMW_019820 [Citrus unshiu]